MKISDENFWKHIMFKRRRKKIQIFNENFWTFSEIFRENDSLDKSVNNNYSGSNNNKES